MAFVFSPWHSEAHFTYLSHKQIQLSKLCFYTGKKLGESCSFMFIALHKNTISLVFHNDAFSGFHFFCLVISIFLLQLFYLGIFRLLSSLRAGINRHQIHTRMWLFKHKNGILTDGILSSLSPAQSTRPKEEHGGCVHSHALVRAWQECHLSESCLGYRNVLRVSV